MLAKTQAWHQVPPRKGNFIISVGEPIPASQYARPELPHSLAARALTRQFENYFADSLAGLRAKSAVPPAETPSVPFTSTDVHSHANS